MASSSLLSVDSEEPCSYEVFISFRGDDTRNNFVSHLNYVLKQRGITTYLDEENLEQGQIIDEELLKAIEESRIAIVVLSTKYGSSSWCLNELVKIMECNKSELEVIPIFYHIDPSDVRKQQNSFCLRKDDDAEKVNIWRKALKEVAGIVGEHILGGTDESSCINNIADEILRRLSRKSSQSGEPMVGIGPRISEIKNLMYSKPNGVLFIGLWGMGGIGKTTIARAVFEDCKNEFGGSCFLQDVRLSKLKKLQKKLVSEVLQTNIRGEGSNLIQTRLKSKMVLLVIDDVDKKEQLDALAKPAWFGKGSVIIVTTRDDHLLDGNYKKIDVKILSEKDSLHLLYIHAFKNDHPPKDYEDLSLQVLRYAGGLPLALKVLGEHLSGRVISFWQGTLDRLKDVPEDEIISKLKISFDGLKDIHQNIFLNIACFFRGFPRYEVEKRLQSLGLHPNEGIDILVSRSLIHIDIKYYKEGHPIEMHDLLQEMGWDIVRQRANKNVKRYSRLWLEKDIIRVLSDTNASSEVEGICMGVDCYDAIEFRLGWEAAFRNMDNLSFLELHGNLFEGNYDVNVPESSGQLYNYNLRWFSLYCYSGPSLPKGFRPMNIVHLSLQHSEIKETPDCSHMPNLEELDLRYSIRLVHVHASLGVHKKVKFINLSYCSKLVEFTKIIQMNSLEELDLSFTRLGSFPEIYGNLGALRKLSVRGTSIKSLPAPTGGNFWDCPVTRRYDVFISYRGEDTGSIFVPHLHSALIDRGIRAHFDESNLQQGQTIADELVLAIEESSIAIVVLSTNYGSSTWCLNELVKLMECKIKSGLRVFPIFYHIEPSDVRKQQNGFFEAFSNHEVNFKDDAETVKIWRKALTEVADLAGVHIRGKDELSCIKIIVDAILERLPGKAYKVRKSVMGIEKEVVVFLSL